MITGCLKPININSLPILAGIAPSYIRRAVASRTERTRQTMDERYPLNGHLGVVPRLKSRKSFIKCTEPINTTAKAARLELWRERLEPLDASVHLNISADEHLPAGADYPWITWKALNRLRTQVGRSRVNMSKWGYSTDPVCASPTVSQMLDDTDPLAQHESDDDDLLLLASLQQTSSSSSTGQLKPAQPRFSSYADSVKTGRRKTNAKSSRSTKPPTTPTPTALIRGSCKGSKLRSANVSRRPASTPRKQVGVFVTRLARSTKAKELVEHVKQETGLNVTCEQLKTKYDTYKSFCLRLSPRNQHCLLNSRVWPSGVMVRGYFE